MRWTDNGASIGLDRDSGTAGGAVIIRTGLDSLLDDVPTGLGRTGWLVCGSSVTSVTLEWGPTAARRRGVDVVQLFAAEHGVRTALAPGQIVEPSRDAWSGLPVCSLYGGSDQALLDAVDRCDTIFIDLLDNGARYNTYPAATIDLIDAVARSMCRPRVVVLDRPNVVGRAQAGPGLTEGFRSIVGRLNVPVRHGLTLGELARFYLHSKGDVDLKVMTARGWDGSPVQSGIYLSPSPNLNCFQAQLLYLGTCLLEGTNVSEGRGTAFPFQQFGAPWIDGARLVGRLRELKAPGVGFRPVCFVPSTSKHAGELCEGAFVHLIDADAVRPIETGVRILEVLFELSHRTELRWSDEEGAPHRFLDLLWGDSVLADHLAAHTGRRFTIEHQAADFSEISLYPN